MAWPPQPSTAILANFTLVSTSGHQEVTTTNSIDSSGKDVIQIAYIPSVIGETPVMSPEPTMQHGGVLKPNFTSLKDEERNKHDSVSSLDEAVVMAVTTKATPQVMKLNAIKATQSDLIQRSNTLHSSNSVKRSKSQRKLANKDRNPSPLASAQPEDGPDNDSDMESPSEDDEGNPFMTEAELATATNVSSYTNDTHDSSVTRAPSPYSNNPFLSLAETKAMSHVTSPPGTPMSETTVFASVPISLEDQQYDPLADLAGGGVRLRPWATSGPTAMRDSTFSTMSDGRSTRGDGEEIMIFWDGSRDSRSNL
ncbi:hypothetical protein BGX31_011281 [Mortierella sp. GBA43]|nr:hypothetical protein BGX31_011281 [Mortierella sp. GBA43]